MSFNAAALKLMADKGLSAHDVAEIAAASEMRSSGAARQARYRARQKGGDVTSDVTPLRNPAPNERDNLTPTRKTKTEAKASSKSLIDPFVLPADIPAEPWDGWEDMRRKIRKVPTDHARSLAVAELRRLRDEEGWPPGEVLNHCTMNSYQGIFPPNRNRPNERSDRDPTTVAVERYLRGDVGSHAGTG